MYLNSWSLLTKKWTKSFLCFCLLSFTYLLTKNAIKRVILYQCLDQKTSCAQETALRSQPCLVQTVVVLSVTYIIYIWYMSCVKLSYSIIHKAIVSFIRIKYSFLVCTIHWKKALQGSWYLLNERLAFWVMKNGEPLLWTFSLIFDMFIKK